MRLLKSQSSDRSMRVRAKAQLSCLADQILQLNHPKLRPAIQFAIALFILQLGTTIVKRHSRYLKHLLHNDPANLLYRANRFQAR